MNKTITLQLDEDDYRSVVNAMQIRSQFQCMPDGESCEEGALIAEICRGWMDWLSQDDPLLVDGLSVAVFKTDES